jgi:hypothetical protein
MCIYTRILFTDVLCPLQQPISRTCPASTRREARQDLTDEHFGIGKTKLAIAIFVSGVEKRNAVIRRHDID